MAATLEIHTLHGQGPYVTLEPDRQRYMVGRRTACDISIEDDDAVSRDHLCIELTGTVWSVTELDARNGTHLNGERLAGRHVLKHNDELALGRHTKLVFLDAKSAEGGTTSVVDPPPVLTPRQHDVLVELLRPMYEGGGAFTMPNNVATMSDALFVVEGAVKNQLTALYDKYGVAPSKKGDEPRYVRLARVAYHRGPISAKDYPKGAE